MPICSRVRESGFTYVGLLIFLAILGLSATLSLQAGASLQREEREDELLFIGSQFQAALQSYHDATPIGQRAYPATLEDLVRDTRGNVLQRHLRKVYVDPMTGRDWKLLMAPEGGIAGVYSATEGIPIKRTGFPPEFAQLEGRSKYSEWVFGYVVVNPGNRK